MTRYRPGNIDASRILWASLAGGAIVFAAAVSMAFAGVFS